MLILIFWLHYYIFCFCLVAKSCPTLCKPIDCSLYQAPLSMEFLRQEYGVGCHFLLQGIFPTQGSSPPLLCLETQKTLFIINNIANGSYLKWKGLFTWDNLCRVYQLTFKLKWWLVNRIAHYRRFGVGIEKYLKNWAITKNSNKVF